MDQRQHDGAAHVGDERAPRHVAACATVARASPGRPHDPPPDATVVGHQEQDGEQAEDGPAEDAQRAGGGVDTLGHGPLVVTPFVRSPMQLGDRVSDDRVSGPVISQLRIGVPGIL